MIKKFKDLLDDVKAEMRDFEEGMAKHRFKDLLDDVKAEMRDFEEGMAKHRLRVRLNELRAARKAHETLEKQFGELLEQSVFDDEEDVDDGSDE